MLTVNGKTLNSGCKEQRKRNDWDHQREQQSDCVGARQSENPPMRETDDA